MAKEVVLAFFLLTDYSGNQWLLIILANCAYIYFKTDGGTNILWSINTKTDLKMFYWKLYLNFNLYWQLHIPVRYMSLCSFSPLKQICRKKNIKETVFCPYWLVLVKIVMLFPSHTLQFTCGRLQIEQKVKDLELLKDLHLCGVKDK